VHNVQMPSQKNNFPLDLLFIYWYTLELIIGWRCPAVGSRFPSAATL
jgi:hypothetical protein